MVGGKVAILAAVLEVKRRQLPEDWMEVVNAWLEMLSWQVKGGPWRRGCFVWAENRTDCHRSAEMQCSMQISNAPTCDLGFGSRSDVYDPAPEQPKL